MKNLLIAILVFISILCPATSFSNHVGGHLTYTYTGVNTYLLKLTLYNECDGPALADSAVVCISSATGGVSFTTVLHQTGTPVELPPFPYVPAMVTSCNGGTFTGFTSFIFEGVVVLPAQFPDWVVSNSSDNMLSSGPSFTNYRPWVYSRIDNLNNPINSSVAFNTDPNFLFCVNQPAWNSYAATDADGDSIVYSFENLLTDTMICPATPTVSTASFSQPLTSSTPYLIDSNAGWINFNPVSVELGSICIKASEYRSQVLINETTFMQNMISINSCVVSGFNVEPNSDEAEITYNNKLHMLHFVSDISSGSLSFSVYDITGRMITSEKNNRFFGEAEFSLQSISSGVYFVRGMIKADGQQINLKPFSFVKN